MADMESWWMISFASHHIPIVQAVNYTILFNELLAQMCTVSLSKSGPCQFSRPAPSLRGWPLTISPHPSSILTDAIHHLYLSPSSQLRVHVLILGAHCTLPLECYTIVKNRVYIAHLNSIVQDIGNFRWSEQFEKYYNAQIIAMVKRRIICSPVQYCSCTLLAVSRTPLF